METWYKAGGWGVKEITPVDVVKETAKQVVILSTRSIEERHQKFSCYESYFKTYQEAYDYLDMTYKNKILVLKERLEREIKWHNHFKDKYNFRNKNRSYTEA